MVNQAFRIKIAYWSEKEEEKKEKEKIPGIGRYPMGPTNIVQLCATKSQAFEMHFLNALHLKIEVVKIFALKSLLYGTKQIPVL